MITFRRRAVDKAADVMDELDRVVQQMPFADSVPITGVSLVTGLNKIRHGLKAAPRTAFAQPRSGAVPTLTQVPDRTFIYLTAAGAQVVDLWVVL